MAKRKVRGLLVVDVQEDFCEGGSLGVAGGNQLARDVVAYLEDTADEYEVVVFSQDWHDPESTNGGHIALPPDEPDFVDSWPPHCIAGTDGARIHHALRDWIFGEGRKHDVGMIRKGQGRPAYSAFEGTSGVAGIGLKEFLETRGVTELDVVGIATDHCVKASVLDGVGEGLKVRVLESMTAGVDPGWTRVALEQMEEAGATLVR